MDGKELNSNPDCLGTQATIDSTDLQPDMLYVKAFVFKELFREELLKHGVIVQGETARRLAEVLGADGV